MLKGCANDVVIVMFRIPSPELSAAAVLETTINTAVYAQQYVRYTKNETIAAAAAAPLLPLPLRSSAAGPCRARYATAGSSSLRYRGTVGGPLYPS